MTQIGETPGYGESLESKTLPPPPPEGNLEVVIRTMASDRALMQKSGGAVQGASSAPTLSIDATGRVARPARAEIGSDNDRTQYVIWGIVFVVGAVVLFLLGYYFIPFLLSNLTPQEVAPVTQGLPPGSQNNSQQPTGSVEPVSFSHSSFFTTTPPLVLDIALYENGLPPDRAGFIRAITTAASAVPDSVFLEIVPRGIGNRQFVWENLAALLGASAIDQTFFTNYLKKDYTVGVLRGAGSVVSPALQPVYVFKLQDDENPILLQKETLSIENIPAAFRNLFFVDPGEVVGTFKDIQMSGQPARALMFKNGSMLVYGWFFNTYLIIGTSENAVKRAIERL